MSLQIRFENIAYLANTAADFLKPGGARSLGLVLKMIAKWEVIVISVDRIEMSMVNSDEPGLRIDAQVLVNDKQTHRTYWLTRDHKGVVRADVS